MKKIFSKRRQEEAKYPVCTVSEGKQWESKKKWEKIFGMKKKIVLKFR
jgi:hypothetical protein